jgi:hypothetical protein
MQESRRAETNVNETILRHERIQKRFTILINLFTLSLLTFFYSQGKKEIPCIPFYLHQFFVKQKTVKKNRNARFFLDSPGMLPKTRFNYALDEIFLKNFTPRVTARPIPTIARATGKAVDIMLVTSVLMALNAASTAVVIPSVIVLPPIFLFYVKQIHSLNHDIAFITPYTIISIGTMVINPNTIAIAPYSNKSFTKSGFK